MLARSVKSMLVSAASAATHLPTARLSTEAAAAAATSRANHVISVQALSTDFRQATKIVERPLAAPKPNQVLIRNRFLGINASDINFTAGRYNPTLQPPFDAGFEALGVVEQVGSGVQDLKVGDAVVYMGDGAFSEFMVLSSSRPYKVPAVDPAYLTCMVSGLTASIALAEAGQIKKGEKVLVTAAAGGTGLWAVQLAALAGCKVYGTVSSDAKGETLKALGCTPINYKTQDLKDVLKKECPGGVDVVYESVGGKMFDTCLNALANKGRLIIIGYITSYANDKDSEKPASTGASISKALLGKSATVRGFFLMQYASQMRAHAEQLISLMSSGKVKGFVDHSQHFSGLASVADAVAYLHSGKNVGKVVVELPAATSKL